MNKNDKNVLFKKTEHVKMNDPQRQKIKSVLMEKYGISSDEAERVLLKIEEKQKINGNDLKKLDDCHDSHVLLNEDDKQQNLRKNRNSNSLVGDSHKNINDRTNSTADSSKMDDEVEQDLNSKRIEKYDEHQKNSNQVNSSFKSDKNVDMILGEIIPNYNQQLSIEVNNIDLTFEVDNEKVDTLKESFINLVKRKKTEKIKIHALNDISFKIYKGEKVGIIGYNGAGKSTLLNVITGSYMPDSGTVNTYGNISPLLGLGAGFDYNFSGRKNIILNGAVLGYEKSFLESKFDEIIEFSELGEFIDIPIKNYSSGMLAKLAFSIATIVEPDILIIDEVLAVGDVNFKKKSSDKIKSLMDGGTTVLLVSHSIPQIRELCDKAIWIDNGKLKEIGEVNEVCNHYLKDAEKASNEQLANIQFR